MADVERRRARRRPAGSRNLHGRDPGRHRSTTVHRSPTAPTIGNRNKRRFASLAQGPHAAEETIRLLAEGKSFEEIAQIRGRSVSSVVNRVADLVEKGRLEYRMEWVGEENHRLVTEAISRLGSERLKPLHETLLPGVTYDQIRLVVAFARRQNPAAS